MTIDEIYAEMDKCEDICEEGTGCLAPWLGSYCSSFCPIGCPTAQNMYRLCAAYDEIIAKRKLEALT